jgi:hypothetical protein
VPININQKLGSAKKKQVVCALEELMPMPQFITHSFSSTVLYNYGFNVLVTATIAYSLFTAIFTFFSAAKELKSIPETLFFWQLTQSSACTMVVVPFKITISSSVFLTAVFVLGTVSMYVSLRLVFIIRDTEANYRVMSKRVFQVASASATASSYSINGSTPSADPWAVLKVRTPVFVLSLPKSGTTSVYKYFLCGITSQTGATLQDRQSILHHVIPTNATTGRSIPLAECMQRNQWGSKKLLQGCGDYKVLTDMGGIWNDNEATKQQRLSKKLKKRHCYFPSVHALTRIATEYPHATILHVLRNSTAWANSASQWSNLLGRMTQVCDRVHGFPPQGARKRGLEPKDVQIWADWYNLHAEQIRAWAHANPRLTYIEASLESPGIGKLFRERFGFSESCWNKCAPFEKCSPV